MPTSSHSHSSPTGECRIDRLGGLGDGLGVWGETPVIAPKTLPGDIICARLTPEREGRFVAEIIEITTASPARREAPCPHYARCGGCSLQHLKQDDYRAFKTEGLNIALRKAGYSDVEGVVHFLADATRRRAEFKVMNHHKQLSLAYAQPRSHTLTPIKECLILTPALQQCLMPLSKAMENLSGVCPEAVSITEANNQAIDVLMHYGKKTPLSVSQAEQLMTDAGAARVSVEVNRRITVLCKSANVEINCGHYPVALPPDAFLQAAADGQQFLTEKVLAATAGMKRILDLFAGIGTYSFALASHASVTAIEGDKTMVTALNATAKRHGISQLLGDSRDLFTRPYTAKELKLFDGVVINPPRAGAASQVVELAKSSISNIVMVSCNAATFARDARTLKNAGFKLTAADGLDQFVYSAHLEIVAHFTR